MTNRSRTELVKRYTFLFVGLMINALGIVLMAKSYLGTSPVSAIPLVLSEIFPITMGTFTFALYFIMFAIQVIILGKKIRISDLLQIPLSIVYSLFIDICVSLVDGFEPSNYPLMLGTFLIGCLFRAMGVSIQITADVAMLSSEAFMITLAKGLKKEFSIIKFSCDIVLVSTAVVISIACSGTLTGIREGTLIATIITAPLTRVFSGYIERFDDKFTSGTYTKEKTHKINKNGEPVIITISSQSGSGGHIIARQLASRLNLPLYDNDLIKMITEKGGFHEDYVRLHMQRLYTNRYWEFFNRNYNYTGFSLESYEPLFEAQTKVIEDIAKQGSSIIVGYCSEYILKDRENVISIYIHADDNSKLQFLKEEYNVDYKGAKDIMKTHDTERALYFRHFTGEEWAVPDRFSFTIDSSLLGLEGTAKLLGDIIVKMEK